MPLFCSISHDPDRVVVKGVGLVTCRDIEDYLSGTIRQGVKGFPKLILLGESTLMLTPAELDLIANRLVEYGSGERPGPVAIVAGNPLNLDMTVLLKQRVGTRPFSIFVDVREAVRWLGRFPQVRVSNTAPDGWTSPFQPGNIRVVASS